MGETKYSQNTWGGGQLNTQAAEFTALGAQPSGLDCTPASPPPPILLPRLSFRLSKPIPGFDFSRAGNRRLLAFRDNARGGDQVDEEEPRVDSRFPPAKGPLSTGGQLLETERVLSDTATPCCPEGPLKDAPSTHPLLRLAASGGARAETQGKPRSAGQRCQSEKGKFICDVN